MTISDKAAFTTNGAGSPSSSQSEAGPLYQHMASHGSRITGIEEPARTDVGKASSNIGSQSTAHTRMGIPTLYWLRVLPGILAFALQDLLAYKGGRLRGMSLLSQILTKDEPYIKCDYMPR